MPVLTCHSPDCSITLSCLPKPYGTWFLPYWPYWHICTGVTLSELLVLEKDPNMPAKQQPHAVVVARRQARRERRRQRKQARANRNKKPPQVVIRQRTPAQQETMSNIRRANRNLDFASSNAGMALTRYLMMPVDSTPVRLPTRDGPPVALTTMRYLSRFGEYPVPDKASFFNDSSFTACLYGQPGLLFADGPHFGLPNTSHDLALGFRSNPVTGTTVGVPVTMANPWVSPPLEWLGQDQDIILNESWPLELVSNPLSWQGDGGFPEYQPVLEHGGKRYAYIQGDDGLYFVIHTQGTATDYVDVNFAYHMLTPDGPVYLKDHAISVSSNGIATGHILNVRGWMDESKRPFAGSWISITMTEIHRRSTASAQFTRFYVSVSIRTVADSVHPRFRLNYLKDMTTTPVMAKEMRRTAATLLISNYSSEYVAQGSIRAERMLPGVPCNPSVAEFANARDPFTGHAKKGVYTYCEFALEDEVFHSHVSYLNGPICRMQITPYNVITISNSTGTTPNTYQITCDIGIEFKTSSQLFTPMVSMLSTADLDMARKINNSTKWFYENPSHFETIWRYVNRAWNLARQNSTRIGSAASILFPDAAPLIMPMARALQR